MSFLDFNTILVDFRHDSREAALLVVLSEYLRKPFQNIPRKTNPLSV